jgi:hypothetical protein
MDQDRQIRFAIPPFFLFGSLLWGAYLGGINLEHLLNLETTKGVLGVLAAAAIALVPIGFVISSLSIFLMRLAFRCFHTPTYEVVLDKETLSRIWKKVHRSGEADPKQILFASATFDHGRLEEGVHLWIFRRWTSMNVALHSSVALVLAHLVAPIFQVPQTFGWWITTVVLLGLFGFNCWKAWSEVMGMLQFQALRDPPEAGRQSEGAAPPKPPEP